MKNHGSDIIMQQIYLHQKNLKNFVLKAIKKPLIPSGSLIFGVINKRLFIVTAFIC
jgi:hypothetical protein